MKKLIVTAVTLFTLCNLFAQEQTKSIQNSQYMIQEKDHDFVEKVLEKGECKIRLAKLAQTKGLSSEVKDFSMQMQRDHQKSNDELLKYASENGYANIPTDITDDSKKDHEKLSDKMGSEFDKAYAKQMVKDHEKMIKLFKLQIEEGKDEQLRTWASQTLPVLEQHLERAKTLHDSVKKSK